MKTAIRTYRSTQKTLLASLCAAAKMSCAALLFGGLFLLSGCSSSDAWKPQVKGVAFTDIDGAALKTQPTSLTTGQGTYVDATLNADPQLLGIDWSAVCGSALPPGTPLPTGQTQDDSCGTFTPAHTMSGPIPTYITNASSAGYLALYVAPAAPPKQGVVTLYASATADHSRVATVTLTVEGQPISVSFAPAPPSSMQAGGSAQFKAVLNNDVTNAGVRWSAVCSSTDCGSFGPVLTPSGVATTYLAPATIPTGQTVQVTATAVADPTKAVSSTITITP